MFKKPTVFILGAGASWHYGYPTGEQLVRLVRDKALTAQKYFQGMATNSVALMPEYVAAKYRSIFDKRDLSDANAQVLAWQESASECGRLNRKLSDVDPLVIDYFLGHNPELQTLGKMLIAWVIRECETESRKELRNINRIGAPEYVTGEPRNDNWLRFVVHRLIVGRSSSRELLSNRVTFVTFNYDMSIEDRTRDALRGNSFFEHRDVAEFLSEQRFLHVYGRIRDRASADFEPLMGLAMADGNVDPSYAKMFFDALQMASKNIRTIEPSEKFDEEIVQRIRTSIADAECIYILGFGFDHNNCKRLGLQPSTFRVEPRAKPKSVMFTNYENSNRVNKAAARAFIGTSDAFLGNTSIADQRGNLRGCYYEKSVRNCYDALAFDFDEIEDL